MGKKETKPNDSVSKDKAKSLSFRRVFFKSWHTRAWLIGFVLIGSLTVAATCVINNVPLIQVTLDNIFGGATLDVDGGGGSYKYYSATSAEESATLSYYDPENKGIASKQDALSAANKLNETICEEGFVLLKNEDQALPIKTPVSDSSLSQKPQVTVFGKNSVNLVYGSTGSGGSDHTGAKSLYESLEAAGFEYNPTMKSFYDNNSASGEGRNDNGSMEQGVSIGLAHGETPWEKYGATQTSSYASAYRDAAIVVFSRTGGEGWDLPRTMKTSSGDKVSGAYSATDHYLELDKDEQEMLVNVCNSFDKVIVVVNSSTPMELGFLDARDDHDDSLVAGMENVHSKIKAAIWTATPGNTGIMALGRILSGQVTPSGHLIDTYERQMDLSPAWKNFSTNLDDDSTGGLGDEYVIGAGSRTNTYFVEYEEGIYVGYRYYETAYYESEHGNYAGFNYDDAVVFPFGYGLSYATFDWELASTPNAISQQMVQNNEEIKIDVKVTNKSTAYSGKDVVQVYFNAPYTAGGIEKAHVVLAGYAKTKLLAPGESETVSVTFDPFTMASYDYADANHNNHKGYELDAGDYTILVAKNAHEAAKGTSLKKTYAIAAHNYSGDPNGKEGNTVQNQFNDISFGAVDSSGKNISERTMSRSDFAGTFPNTPTQEDRTVDYDFLDTFDWTWKNRKDEEKDYYVEEMPTFAESASGETTIKLHQLIGKAWDDPLWAEFLEQLTIEEMSQLIGKGCYSTIANTRIGLPSSTSADGPVGLVNFFTNMVDLGQKATVYDVCSYASACVMGATWNDALAYEEGVSLGNECVIGNEAGDGKAYTGWYAPGVNIHRTPFSGRNSEYYSEDGLLSGKMAAQVIHGAYTKGVYTTVKHFAVNDQETHRNANGISVWLTEQAMREVYLKPFQLSVEEGDTNAIMTSFNRLGPTWAGGSYALLTEVLRKEWGFVGLVITDFNTDSTTYMNVDQMIRAGGDLDLAQDKPPSLVDKKGESRLTPTQASLIIKAAHNILYVIANSNVMNGLGEGVAFKMGLSSWQKANIWIDVGIGVALLAWGAGAIALAYRKEKRRLTEEA